MDNRQKGCAIGCGVLTAILAILLMFGTTWVRNTFIPPAPPAPAIPANVTLRARYLLTDGRAIDAGCAVAARLQPGGEPVLLTPLSPFGPDAGHFKKGVPPAEINEVVREVELRPIGSDEVVARAKRQLRTSGPAFGVKEQFVTNDVLAWTLEPGGAVEALDLATENPRLFRWTWMVGDSPKHAPQAQRLFAGRVVGNQDREAWLKLDERFPVDALSGAAVVNGDRQLVGFVSRGFPGRVVIVPAGLVRRRLAESGVQ